MILLKQTNYDQLTMYDLRLLKKARLQTTTWRENMKMSAKQRWPGDFYIWWDFEHKNASKAGGSTAIAKCVSG